MKRNVMKFKLLLLKLFLVFSGAFQIFFWGASHIFFPKWYLVSVADKDPNLLNVDTLLWVNEIGVSTIGVGIVTILAAFNPVRHYGIIVLLFILGVGSVSATLVQILVRQASNEWEFIAMVVVQLTLLALLYPWGALRQSFKA